MRLGLCFSDSIVDDRVGILRILGVEVFFGLCEAVWKSSKKEIREG